MPRTPDTPFYSAATACRQPGCASNTDRTAAAGIARTPGCLGLTFVDYDHDGDLDLYVTSAAGGGPNVLWRNNGNGTFTDVSAATALGIPASAGGVPAQPN